MVYAYDRNILMPVKDLYDTKIMALALSAAKDEYDKAEKRLDDLTKLYGDFYSPSDVDMTNWQTKVVDPIKGAIDDLYARGIDPLRSAEGLAMLARVSRSLPLEDMNKLRQSAKTMQKYLDNMADLQAKNLYNPDYETRYLGYDVKNWNTLDREKGIWNRISPDPVPSLQAATTDWYKNRTARSLSPEEVSKYGSYDPRKDYTGYLYSDLLGVAGENIPGFIGTQVGGYYADLAKKQLEQEAVAAGKDPKAITLSDINRRFAENVASANRQWEIAPIGEINPFVLDDYKTNNSIRAYKQKYNYSHGDTQTQNPFAQSYARDMYMTAIGQIFGVDMYTASLAVANNSAGKKIFFAEQDLLKKLNYDVDLVINAHTSAGNSASNAKLLDIPTGGSVRTGSSSNSKTLNSQKLFTRSALGDKKLYDASEIVFTTAGYSKSGLNRTKDAVKNQKLLNKATYFTVTEENVGHLNKNGQFRTYVKVIGDNGAIGYVRANVDSNVKHGGQAYSSAVKNRDLDLGWNGNTIGTIKLRDLMATDVYTKQGAATNDGALEPEIDEDILEE